MHRKVLKRILELGILNTIRLNFHYLPIKNALKFPIIASRHLRIRSLKGNLKILNPKTACVRLGFDSVGIFDSKKDRSIWDIGSNAALIIEEKAYLGNGFKICIMDKGKLVLGNGFRLTSNSTIVCEKGITFGRNCLTSWNVLVMDTDFHKIKDVDNQLINKPREITIGENVWIGCRTTILKGSQIADNCVIAASSVVTGTKKNRNTIYGGNPANIIKSEISWQL